MAYHSKYSGAEVDSLLDKIKADDVGSIDSSLSTTSENPVQNKVITEELNKKANKTDIATINGKPLTNGGNIEVVTGSYDDTEIKGKLTELETQTTSLNSRTPVDSGISFMQPWEYFPEYSEDVQDVQNYILPGFLQINNQMTNVDGLFNHIRDNNLAGKAAYFTIYGSSGNPSTAIIGNIDTGAVGYKISFSTISRYSDNTSFNNRLIFFEIEIGNLTGDGITIMNSRLMNICIKDTLSQIDNNTSKIQTLETKNSEFTNTISMLESRIAELENIILQITIKEE